MSAAGLAFASGCVLLPAQPRAARVGYLWSGVRLIPDLPAAFRAGLRDAGWTNGQNLVIEERTFGGQVERAPELATELVALKPDVLVTGTTDVVLAFMRLTNSIPIVFMSITDPVGVCNVGMQ